MSARVEFGTFLLLQSPSGEPSDVVYRRGVEIAQAADELGFRSTWLAEHHFSTYDLLSRPLAFALHLANKTRRIRVGTAVIVVPLHHPLTIAEEIATVDVLSGGRLDIGLGRGYQRYEFERFGRDLSESRGRWDEAVDVILLALAGKPFSYDGTYFKIPETSIFPQPVQKPHPPFWVTAQSPESIDATVRRGFDLITGGYGVSLERLGEFRRTLDARLAEYRRAQPIRVAVQRPVYVAEGDAEARGVVEQARWNMRVTLSLRRNYERIEEGRAIPVPFEGEPTTDEFLDNFSVIGTPDTCIRQIRRLQDVMGLDIFNCAFSFGDVPQDKVLASMRRFARDVMPAFKS